MSFWLLLFHVLLLLSPNSTQSFLFLPSIFLHQVGAFHNVAHLVLEEIPVHDGETSAHSVRDITAMEVELKAESKVCIQGVAEGD